MIHRCPYPNIRICIGIFREHSHSKGCRCRDKAVCQLAYLPVHRFIGVNIYRVTYTYRYFPFAAISNTSISVCRLQ